MVPRGRIFVVGCSDGDVFAFQAKVNTARGCDVADVLRSSVKDGTCSPQYDAERTEGGDQGSETNPEKTRPLC